MKNWLAFTIGTIAFFLGIILFGIATIFASFHTVELLISRPEAYVYSYTLAAEIAAGGLISFLIVVICSVIVDKDYTPNWYKKFMNK